MKLRLFLLLPTLLVPTLLPAQVLGHLIVANKADAAIGIIDTTTGKQVAAVPEDGFTAHEVAVSPDGRTAFAPVYGNAGVATAGTNGQFIDVIDLTQARLIGKIDFGRGVRPHDPVFDPNSGLLYVTTEIDQTVSIIDPRSLKILGSIPTTQPQSHMLVLSHDGSRGYTANVSTGTVSILDLKSRTFLALVKVSGNTQRIAISNDDKLVFTADQTKPQIAVIDTAARSIKSWIPLPAIAYGTASTPDGRWLVAALPSTNQVAIIDLKTLTVARTVDVAKDPQAVIIRPDGKEAYVSCPPANTVSAIDLTTFTVRLIPAGKGVDGLAWAQ